jgi:hypothetical protein
MKIIHFSTQFRPLALAALIIPLFLMASCTANNFESPASQYPTTQAEGISLGLVRKELKIGTSTQEDVIRRFGSPTNIVMSGSGKGEIWIYDQIRTEAITQLSSQQSSAAIGAGGGSIGVAAGTRNANSKSFTTSTVRTLTVILDFDPTGKLVDISARQGGY